MKGRKQIFVPQNARIAVVTDEPFADFAVSLIQGCLDSSRLKIVSHDEIFRKKRDNDSVQYELIVFLSTKAGDMYRNLLHGVSLEGLIEGSYIIAVKRFGDTPAVFLSGGGQAGMVYAAREFSSTITQEPGGSRSIEDGLLIKRIPSNPYRLFWTWDHSTNWFLEHTGIQEIGAMNYYSKPKEAFLDDYEMMIDFMSRHRIGGVTIYGLLRDNHGGIEAAVRLCEYARQRGVRILAGVGINAYGGVYWEGTSEYNLSNWLMLHPDLKAVTKNKAAFVIPDMPELWFPENRYTDMACPSKKENLKFHEDSLRWLVRTVPVNGINFETGDYGVCECGECSARRASDAKWSHKDMATLYPRLFSAVREERNDLLLVCEAYWDTILNKDVLSCLKDLPDDAVYQFCINKSYWPNVKETLTPAYVSSLPTRNNILRTHIGSQWNKERYSYVAETFVDIMRLSSRTGLQGATIFGEAGAFNTVNEINYLAFAVFGYDAEKPWEEFFRYDLSPLLGDIEETKMYLKYLAIDDDVKSLKTAIDEVREIMISKKNDVYRRWVWLQDRLLRKHYSFTRNGCLP